MHDKIHQSVDDVTQAKRRLSMTKYIFLLAILAWPIGLLISAIVSLIIFASLMCLACVSAYIAYMHYLTLRKRMAKR